MRGLLFAIRAVVDMRKQAFEVEEKHGGSSAG